MATFVWGVLCRRVIVDQGNNSVTYVDAIEGLGAVRFPVPAPLVIIASLWQRSSLDEDRITVQGRIEDPDGRTLAGDIVVLQLTKNHKRGRIHIGLRGFEMPRPGLYWAVLEQKTPKGWKEEQRIPLEIELAESPAALMATMAPGSEVKPRSAKKRVRRQRRRSG